jgi:hypothetical protein
VAVVSRDSAGGSWQNAQNSIWRDIAFFVIALLIVCFLMLLGVVIAADRLCITGHGGVWRNAAPRCPKHVHDELRRDFTQGRRINWQIIV